MIILWHIRFLLLTLIFISVVFPPDHKGLECTSRLTLLSPLLKVPRMVLLSSLLWWELGTNLRGHGPGEWLSFWLVTSKHFWIWFCEGCCICHYLSWKDSIKPSLLFSNFGCCISKGSPFRLSVYLYSDTFAYGKMNKCMYQYDQTLSRYF